MGGRVKDRGSLSRVLVRFLTYLIAPQLLAIVLTWLYESSDLQMSLLMTGSVTMRLLAVSLTLLLLSRKVDGPLSNVRTLANTMWNSYK